MAEVLSAGLTSPSAAAERAEATDRLREALESMNPLEREVLCLRHFEHLTNAEVAGELDIEPAAASKRYVRALTRLEEILRALGERTGGFEK